MTGEKLKIEVGKTYLNGWGTAVPIVRSEDVGGCALFWSDMGGFEHAYHSDGTFFGLSQSIRLNLVSEAGTRALNERKSHE